MATAERFDVQKLVPGTMVPNKHHRTKWLGVQSISVLTLDGPSTGDPFSAVIVKKPKS